MSFVRLGASPSPVLVTLLLVPCTDLDRCDLRRTASAGQPWHARRPSRRRPWRDCRRPEGVSRLHSWRAAAFM